MNFLSEILPISFIFILFLIATQRKQLLSTLLTLEIIIITIIFIILFTITATTTEIFYLLILLTFAATEARVGLATLVTIIRFFGTDTLNLTTPTQC